MVLQALTDRYGASWADRLATHLEAGGEIVLVEVIIT